MIKKSEILQKKNGKIFENRKKLSNISKKFTKFKNKLSSISKELAKILKKECRNFENIEEKFPRNLTLFRENFVTFSKKISKYLTEIFDKN